MRRHMVLAGLLWIANGGIAAAQLTPEQAIDRRSIADLRFSPDGSQLAMTVAGPPEAQGRDRDVWVLDVAKTERRGE